MHSPALVLEQVQGGEGGPLALSEALAVDKTRDKSLNHYKYLVPKSVGRRHHWPFQLRPEALCAQPNDLVVTGLAALSRGGTGSSLHLRRLRIGKGTGRCPV